MRSFFSRHGADVALTVGTVAIAAGVGLFTHPGAGLAVFGMELVIASLLSQRAARGT